MSYSDTQTNALPNAHFLKKLKTFNNFSGLVGVLLLEVEPKTRTSNFQDETGCVIRDRILLIMLGFFPLMLLGPQRVKAQDGPAPVVARLSVAQGDVSTLRCDSKEWLATTTNAPVVHGDTISTGPGSRAEIQLDYENVLRLDQVTEAKLADLTRTRIQIQVASGLATFSVFKGTDADLEIDTPNMAIHALGEGVYRIQVNSAESTQLTVRRGHAEVTTPQGGTNVDKGQIIYVKGTEYPEYQMAQWNDKDDWDRWNDDHDHAIFDAQSWQHTNHYYTGSEELDRYGDWIQVPGYDWCWTPYVDAGWVPYRDGRWVSDPYYGWMWVGYEPWGWAPYHYGRWFSYDGNWCWWPAVGFDGPRPIWGPGYVAFLGFGGPHGESGPGVGFDSIGWCPLGPRDRFNPWWGRGRGFASTEINNINTVPAPRLNDPAGRDYGTNLQGIMTNAHLRSAITTVSAQNFANGRIVHNLQAVNIDMLQQGSLMQGTLPVTPTKASLQLLNRPVNPASLPPAAANNQHFVTRSAGPASRTALPAGQINPSGNVQRAGGSAPAPAGSMATATHPGMVGSQEKTAISAQTARPVTGQPGTPARWPQFGRDNRITRSTESMNKPGADGPQKTQPAPRNAEPRQLTPAPQGNQGGWKHFGSQSVPANRGAGGTATHGEGGWKHFEPPPTRGGTIPGPRDGRINL